MSCPYGIRDMLAVLLALARVYLSLEIFTFYYLSAKISHWSDKIKGWIRPNVLMVNRPLRLTERYDVML
jgi:hypothetical protein